MNQFQTLAWVGGPVLSLALLAACSTVRPDDEPTAFAPPTALTATLTNGGAQLTWHNQATAEGGLWTEFATPGSEFTMLKVYLSEQNATDWFHPAIAPASIYLYRILPFFGRPTKPVEITTGSGPATNAVALEEGPLPETDPVARSGPKWSLRNPRTLGRAMPSGLTVTLSAPDSVDLHWIDNASDEDGYLVEVTSKPERGFEVSALLPPGTQSFRQVGLPLNIKGYFRVRAFFYGRPSATTSVTTPLEMKSDH